MSIRVRVEEWLLEVLERRRRRGSFVVDMEIERGEERRLDRLGLTEDHIKADEPDWKPPPPALADPWRPQSTLPPYR